VKYEIKNRFTGAVQFVADIECDKNASVRIKVGLSVKWAINNRANLMDANLIEADLIGADLSGADLSGANLSGADLRRA